MSTDRSNARVERWNDTHPRWPELMALPDVEDLHLETKVQEWHLGIYTLVALQTTSDARSAALSEVKKDDVIAGTLRFWTQVIGVDEDRPPFVVDGEPAVEAKVVTLHVLDAFRGTGIGQELQVAAVRWARELGCYQVRSRSPYASADNHQLKASLGFGISPGRDRADGERQTAFFVLPLRVAPELVAAAQD